MIDTLIVLAKEPRPGFAKTRLTPPLTPQDAARVAGASLRDTLDAATRTPARRRLLAFDGDPSGWTPPGWDVVPQPAGGLDTRITAAFDAADAGSAVLVGMDTPQLQPHHLVGFDPARDAAALGLAADGGFWALGLRDARRAADVVPGVPMSRACTGATQYARLQVAGLAPVMLDVLVDVDTADDLHAVAAVAPLGRFRQVVADLRPALAGRAG